VLLLIVLLFSLYFESSYRTGENEIGNVFSVVVDCFAVLAVLSSLLAERERTR
jgi:hypothetical protein